MKREEKRLGRRRKRKRILGLSKAQFIFHGVDGWNDRKPPSPPDSAWKRLMQ
jgi:hypothetical protein